MSADPKSALLPWPREPVRPIAEQHAKLSISVVSINYFPEPTGIAVYSTGMAEFLNEAGHGVLVYTAFPYYPAWRKREEDRGRVYGTDQIEGVTVRRNFIYVPARLSAFRRILHELSFTVTAASRYLAARRSDVTVIVSPPLLLATAIGILARLRRSKIVLHVQDLQPDAAVDLGMLKPGILTQTLFAIERLNYRLADRVSTISLAMQSKIESKGVPGRKTLILKNWADAFLPQSGEADADFRRTWQLDGKFVVLYAGNMGVKQGLESLLDSAAALRNDADFAFVIVGDGGEKVKLQRIADERGLTNVQFQMPVPKDRLGQLLALADVAVIPQKAQINDLVLPSKLGNLMASGTPVIVAAEASSELAQIVGGSVCGLVCPPEDGAAMANAALRLKLDRSLRTLMGENGRAYAAAHLSRQSILKRFEAELCELAIDSRYQPRPIATSAVERRHDTVHLEQVKDEPSAMPENHGNAFTQTPGWPLRIILKRLLWVPFRLLFLPGTSRFLSPLRVTALRLFGARIGRYALISAGVRVWYPWNLSMGSRSTLGPNVEVYNFASVTLGDDATVSQYTYLCTATHDYTNPAMPLTFRSIVIGDKAWVAASNFIGPGVTVGQGAVVGACSVVTRDVPPWTVVAGNPVREIKPRRYHG